MRIKYEFETTPYGQAIIADNDGLISVIPIDPANSDYQAYLKSLEQSTEKVTDEANTL
jgi:hypothetical protein